MIAGLVFFTAVYTVVIITTFSVLSKEGDSPRKCILTSVFWPLALLWVICRNLYRLLIKNEW